VRRIADAGLVALPLAIAVAIVGLETWHGPTVLSLSASHGIDSGDLPAALFVVLAIGVARTRVRVPRRGGWSGAAVAVGIVLLLAGVLTREGGALKPAGGGVVGGSLSQTVGARPVPVGRWTHLAMTYDGAQSRLYVNGDQVSSHPGEGPLLRSAKPLWIGGNLPWGSHFDGAIDDVRVYGRALSAGEIRRDMARPAAPAPRLVAAYTFDGRSAQDVSGHGNTGEIAGATRTRGRHGAALRFDGAGAVVRIPAAPSLNLTRVVTLSAWIRPDARQSGWRTIIQRQTAAYFLIASSDRINRAGAIDDLRIAMVGIVLAWFALALASTPARRRWWMPVAVFALGSLADVVIAPDGSLIGPMLVATWLAATARVRGERLVLALAGAVCAGLTVASLTNVAGLREPLSHNGGGTARTAALGAVFLLCGLAAISRERERGELWKLPVTAPVVSDDTHSRRGNARPS
jgi:hypothetical protein